MTTTLSIQAQKVIAYCEGFGTLDSEGKKHTPLNWTWNLNDRDRIAFAAIPISLM